MFEYSTSPTTLATFSDANNIGYRPVAGVIADAEGDLFGTVRFPSGANDGAVFEIANGTTTVTQVVGFTGGDDGGAPEGPLIADAAGDLFGTTSTGGAGGQGTVFEIAYNGTSYATTATTLVTFNLAGSADGANPLGGLITDANGDLFGTTSSGGAHGDGTVFEIAYNGTSYATMATTLVNFDGTGDGANPADTLLIDSNGNLYGTTQNGGAAGDGTVFELAKTETGYASTPTTLVTFNGSGNGANPYAGLIADPAGDLFGTTQNGGTDGDGTVFEVVSTGANFDPLIAGTAANQAVTDAATIDPFSAVTITDPKSGQTETVTVTLSNAANGSLVHLSGGNFSDGVYTYTGTAAQVTLVLDGLRFLPTDHQVAPGQTVTTTFTIADTDTFGATATDSTSSVVATAVAVPIAIIGTAADQEATDRSTINPFANVTISDPNAGQTETVTLTLSTTANGTLTNLGGFIATATLGVYTDTNTAAAVTMDLQGLVFTPTFYPGVVGETATTGFTIADTDTTGENATDSTTTVIATAVPILTTLVTFNSTGENPHAGLIADAAGDLFGTTAEGAGSSYGTVFEIARTGVGIFATSPTTLVTFTGTGNLGAQPYGGLIADAAGDLLGTTPFGGDDNADGTVFVVAKTATGYATTATTLIAFNGAGDGSTPYAGVISDAAGDLFGMTSNSGPGGGGTVFEIANNGTGYATTPTTLVSFNGGNGANPSAGLVANAAGDLFGTEAQGAVFEIADTGAGYATSPTTLATFSADGSEGADPLGTLIIDAAGNLIGTTYERGPGGDGTVFEIANTANGYASTPITLVSFNGTGNGAFPYADLIADAAGDLFGTTSGGGADGDGTVFEIANTITGYASTAITLATFDGTSNGADPYGGLIADAAGDLFGTTESGGSTGDGTAFELHRHRPDLRPGDIRHPGGPAGDGRGDHRPVRRCHDHRRQLRPDRDRDRHAVQRPERHAVESRRRQLRCGDLYRHRHRRRSHRGAGRPGVHAGGAAGGDRPDGDHHLHARRRQHRERRRHRHHDQRHRHGGAATDHAVHLQRHPQRGGPRRRPARRRQRRPVRHDGPWRGEQGRHGVRARQERRHLCRHADHARHLRRHQQRQVPGRRPDRQCGRGPVRRDPGRRRKRRRHGVRDRQQQQHRLRYVANHAGHLHRRRQRRDPVWRPDHECRRGPARHDKQGRGGQRRHGVRDGQHRRRLRGAHHSGHVRRHRQRGNAGVRPAGGRRRRPVRHDKRRRRGRRRHGVRDLQQHHGLRDNAHHGGHLHRRGDGCGALRQPDHRCRGRPVRGNDGWRRGRRRHRVRDRQYRHRLRRHADHVADLRWRRQRGNPRRLPDRRCRRGPVRHDRERRRRRRRHSVRTRQNGNGLRRHADHAGHVHRYRKRIRPAGQPDRRCGRRPVWLDAEWRRGQRRHAVRAAPTPA